MAAKSESKICEGFAGSIGKTPMVRIPTLCQAYGCEILGKAEFQGPGGSVKDRAALYMIEGLERAGKLKPGGLVVESTAGNTGIGLVLVCNAKGYKCLFAHPEKVAKEKVELLQLLGAETVGCPAVPSSDPDHFINTGKRLAEERGGVFTNQFDNLDNMKAHMETTGPEIYEQTDGKLDAVVMCCGTGGSIAGISTYLKGKDPSVKCFLMDTPGQGICFEPAGEGAGAPWVPRMRTEEEKEASGGSSIMEGIGSSLLYGNVSQAKVDGVFKADDETAIKMAHYLLKKEGLYLGGSAAANVVAACMLAKKLGPGHTIVTLLCDSGARYASKMYNPEWLAEKEFSVEGTDDLKFMDKIFEMNAL